MFAERYLPQRFETIIKDPSIKRIIFSNKQKCLACPKSIRLINGKLKRFPIMQDRNKKYTHAENCLQKERF